MGKRDELKKKTKIWFLNGLVGLMSNQAGKAYPIALAEFREIIFLLAETGDFSNITAFFLGSGNVCIDFCKNDKPELFGANYYYSTQKSSSISLVHLWPDEETSSGNY